MKGFIRGQLRPFRFLTINCNEVSCLSLFTTLFHLQVILFKDLVVLLISVIWQRHPSLQIFKQQNIPIFSTLNHILTIFSCCVLWCNAHIDKLCTLSCVFVAASSFFSTQDSSSVSILWITYWAAFLHSATQPQGARISPSLLIDQQHSRIDVN